MNAKTTPAGEMSAPFVGDVWDLVSFANRCADRGKLWLAASHRGTSRNPGKVRRIFVKDSETLNVHEVPAIEGGLPWVRTIRVSELTKGTFFLQGGAL